MCGELTKYKQVQNQGKKLGALISRPQAHLQQARREGSRLTFNRPGMKDPFRGTHILGKITNLPAPSLDGEIRRTDHINKCLEF